MRLIDVLKSREGKLLNFEELEGKNKEGLQKF
jgi:hypothetical protein